VQQSPYFSAIGSSKQKFLRRLPRKSSRLPQFALIAPSLGAVQGTARPSDLDKPRQPPQKTASPEARMEREE
jgi:hypothetical protein